MKLKTCPFCGNEAKILKRHYYSGIIFVPSCTGKDCFLNIEEQFLKSFDPPLYFPKKQYVIDEWNTRNHA